jgi:hypothetical protein
MRGKKITWRDGVGCICVLARVRIARGGSGVDIGDVSPIAAEGYEIGLLQDLERRAS